MNILRKNPGRAAASGGFTLIELLVSAIIGLLVLMAVSYAFVGGRHTYVLNSEMMRMQESSRAVMEALRRDMRMAAFRGCADMSEVENFSSALDATSFNRFKQGLHVASVYTDAITAMADTYPSTGMEIHGVGANAGEASLNEEFIAGSSSGAVAVVGGELAERLGTHSGVVLLSDCSGAAFLDSAGGSITGGSGSISVSATGGDSGQIFARGAQFYQYAQPRTFRLKAAPETFVGATSPVASLYYNAGGLASTDALEELARGVEAFRLCAVDEKGVKTRLDPANEAASAALLKNAVQVQVDMVLISFRPEVLPEAALYEMRLCGETTPDTVSYAKTDRRLRRLFSASIAVRNRISTVLSAKDA